MDLETIVPTSVFVDFADELTNTENEKEGEFLALYVAANETITAKHTSGDTNTKTGYVKITINAKVLGTANATINLGNYGTFTLTQNNDWQAIEVYVKTGSTTIGTITPEFSLTGTQNSIALFDEVTFEIVDSATYNAAQESALVKKVDNEAKEQNKSASKKASTNRTMIFFVVLSSALLVGAVLVAVIARAVKRLPKRTKVELPQPKYNKKPNSKSKNDKGFV